MKSAEIRDRFLKFFASKGHQIVGSSSLVPHEDPTLLFTNAGMNQFKDVFLGFDQRPYKRATTSQKCVRAGGKHNDLENVGYTARHHTFFEMLGNFSFGDYFKREAIHFAWELLTKDFKLPVEKLLATVYAEDDEAYTIWTEQIGLPPEKVIRIGDNKGSRYASDNFWMMGDIGPCGPCSEIFYDHGAHIPGGPPGSPDEDGDRFIEIWNNVFMQFNRDEQDNMHPLPKPSVDTGMGLERISAILQGVHSNYEIDLFQSLIATAAKVTHTSDLTSPSLKVIADHIRACSFLIADSVIPGNEGRGYVLRRIIRRAIRHGYKLGARAAFFYQLVPALAQEMGEAYPELRQQQEKISATLLQEEQRFFATIENGMTTLEDELAAMLVQGKAIFDGNTAFRLHDTYGFPLDLTADVCRERNVNVDVNAFDQAMANQKAQARAAGKFKASQSIDYQGGNTDFLGYQDLQTEAVVLALYREGSKVDQLQEGEQGIIVLDKTPFYAESGGQVGDTGELRTSAGLFAVEDTQKIQAAVFGHIGVVKTGVIRVADKTQARVNIAVRISTARNHSVTHIMHKALREVLGEHVQQKGSLVDAERTRFDFAHSQTLSAAEIERIERIVNTEILANTATEAKSMALDDARNSGAVMLFGEKYADEVRVLSIGSSKELCGGTHVARTGDIGLFKIISEAGVAAGVRRIEAITGNNSLALIFAEHQQLRSLADRLKSPTHEIGERIEQLLEQQRHTDKELQVARAALARGQSAAMLDKVRIINGVQVLAAELPGADANSLRETLDWLKDKLGEAVILLGSTQGADKASLIAGVGNALTTRFKAGELVNLAAQKVSGKGGGRADMAQAGGSNPAGLAEALAVAEAWVAAKPAV